MHDPRSEIDTNGRHMCDMRVNVNVLIEIEVEGMQQAHKERRKYFLPMSRVQGCIFADVLR